MRLTSIISFIFILAMMASCGSKGEGVSLQTSTDVTKISIEAQQPNDVLYVQSDKKTVYTATGNGGIGESAAFESTDSLTPYSGIPIKMNGASSEANQKPNVVINVSGDKDCINMFSFDSPSSLIKIDATKVTQLTQCSLQISAEVNVEGLPLTTQTSLEVTLNPTLKAYYEAQDKFVAAWMNQVVAGGGDLASFAKAIKSTPTLALKWDTKNGNLANINALTGAKNITAVDFSNTQLQNTRALQFLPALQEINLSQTRVSQESLAQLSSLSSLKKLTVQNVNLQDVTFITENIKSLEYLDISNNKVSELKNISNLTKLNTLVASNIDLNSDGFNDLEGMTQITSLNLSNNDLSSLTSLDAKSFANLYALKELNVSETKISDTFLSNYFALIANRNNMTKFVDKNIFDKNDPKKCGEINHFYDPFSLVQISLPTSLEYLDVGGNSCIDGSGYPHGTTALNFISNLNNLTYLDISSNNINDLSQLENERLYKNLPPEGLIINDLGSGNKLLSQKECLTQLTGKYAVDCSNLAPDPVEFSTPGTYEVVVPNSAKSMAVMGCDGGDGGQGGQGGRGGFELVWGNRDGPGWANFTRNADGGAFIYSYYMNSPFPALGTKGEEGGFTTVDGLFPLNEAKADPQLSLPTLCKGGSPGAAGTNGGIGVIIVDGQKGIALEQPSLPTQLASMGAPGIDKKMFLQNNIKVTPGQTITIHIGKGGAGGSGSAAEASCGPETSGPTPNVFCGAVGSAGQPGGQGTSGYLKILWGK